MQRKTSNSLCAIVSLLRLCYSCMQRESFTNAASKAVLCGGPVLDLPQQIGVKIVLVVQA